MASALRYGLGFEGSRLFYIVLLLALVGQVNCVAPVEQNTLLDLKKHWKDPSKFLESWVKGKDCNSSDFWYGVQCNASGFVTQLFLQAKELSGPIPSSIGNLQFLTLLGLSNNRFSGSIPSSIGNLVHLTEYLDFSGNGLSGPIPSSIGNLRRVSAIFLYDNKLTGPIPTSFGKLKSLNVTFLNNNQLSGPIPSSFWNLTALKYLYLEGNYFTGLIPTSFKESVPLESFDWSNNCFKGELNQKSSAQCSAFCGADSATGPCTGHGICAFNVRNKPQCTCDKGTLAPNCTLPIVPPKGVMLPKGMISPSSALPPRGGIPHKGGIPPNSAATPRG